jgi:hypothetical protein
MEDVLFQHNSTLLSITLISNLSICTQLPCIHSQPRFRCVHTYQTPLKLSTSIKMKFTAVIATVLSMAVFAVALPTAVPAPAQGKSLSY